MPLHRLRRDEDRVRDLPIAQSLGDEGCDLPLSRAEILKAGRVSRSLPAGCLPAPRAHPEPAQRLRGEAPLAHGTDVRRERRSPRVRFD
jgi:hypothetical protein